MKNANSDCRVAGLGTTRAPRCDRKPQPRFKHKTKLALAVLLSAASFQAHALFSCDAYSGPSLGGGTSDFCQGGSDASASVISAVQGATVDYFGSAHVDAETGSLGGAITVAHNTLLSTTPGAANGKFSTNFLADFRITGPASVEPVPVSFLYSIHGSIAGTCIECDGQLSYRFQIGNLDGEFFQYSSQGSRSLRTDWLSYSTTSGLNSTASTSAPVQDRFFGTASFDALVNQSFRVRGSLGGSVNFIGANPSGATLSADAGNTALFNIVLPVGYSLTPVQAPAGFLSAPVLQAIPEPSEVWMMSAGLLVLVLGARRRTRFAGTPFRCR